MKMRKMSERTERKCLSSLNTGQWNPDCLLLLFVYHLLDLRTNAANVISMDNS